jgi:hypothetical protein
VRDAAEPPQGANAFAVHLSEPDDAGRVVATVSAVLPAPDGGAAVSDAWLARELAALRASLLEALDDVIPFVGSHILLAHSPHEAAPPEVPGGRSSGPDVPRALPVAPRPLWRGGGVEGSAGLAIAPYATGVKNLTIASSQVLSHLGLEGDLATGWSAAKIAHAIAGKKKDYLRDEVLSPT